MTRKFTAAVLALSLTLTSVSAIPARAGNDEELGRFFVGAISLFVIAKAIENKKRARRQTSQSNYNPAPTPPKQPPRFNKRLPSECFFRMRTANGPRGVYGKICLQETMRHANRLPAKCEDTVRVRYGLRSEVYGAKCLRKNGYRDEARRR